MYFMTSSLIYSFKDKLFWANQAIHWTRCSPSCCSQQCCTFWVILLQKMIHLAMMKDIYTLFMLFVDAVSDLRNARKVWVPHLWNKFNKEKETDSKRPHFSETAYLISMYILLVFFVFFFVNFVHCLFSSIIFYSNVVSHFSFFI